MSQPSNSNVKEIDYLDEDPVIESQRWICVSFLSPEAVKNCKVSGWKFRGAFATQQEAEAHAKQIQEKLDPDFHVFIGEGFKWLPFAPDPDSIEKQEYHEKELNELMKATKEQLLLKKQHEGERKKKLLEQAMKENEKVMGQNREDVKREKLRDKLRKKHMKKVQQMQTEEEIEEQEKEAMPEEELKTVMEKVNEDEKKLEDEKKDVAELSNSVQRLQAVYNQLLEKSKKK